MKLNTALFIAAAAIAPVAAVTALPAQAQVNGVATADPNKAIADSNAWKAAEQQLQTTYATQLAQARTRSQALQAELAPLAQAFDAARRAPNPNEAALRTQLQQLQQREQAANAELSTILAPYQRARAYVVEQIQAQLEAAANAAVTRKQVRILLRPEALALPAPTADITADITTELNRLVPTVNTTPPANWQPGGQGQTGGATGPAATPPAATPPRRTGGR